MFNILVAYPVIKNMRSLQEDLIGVGAIRYTRISNIVSLLVGGALLFVVIYFCDLYLIISFAVGAVGALVFISIRTKPSQKESFDLFSNAYCRFVPDDELRTILFNKDYGKVKARLRDMGIKGSCIPNFK